jgi:hypothetical protein
MVHQGLISHSGRMRLDYRPGSGNNVRIVKARPRSSLPACAVLAWALLWLSPTLAEQSGCLIAGSSDTPDQFTAELPLLSLARPSRLTNSIEVRCDQLGLAEVVVEIEPGQTFSLELMIDTARTGSARLSLAEPLDDPLDSAWLQIQPLTEAPRGRLSSTLVFRAPPELAPGERHETSLQIQLGDSIENRSIPITLIVVPEGPLFRNRFEVDPVLGQFSYRLPPPQAPEDAARASALMLAARSL